MNRRTLLAGAPLAGLAATLPRPTLAAAHAGAALPGAQRFEVGDRAVTALLDGALQIDRSQLTGVDDEAYEAAMRDAYRDPASYRSAVNGFLVDAPEGVILVDAGTGTAMGPDLGRLPDNLQAAGVAPEDVTLLIATHLHPDHVGGAVVDGAARFPNAEMVVHRADRDFWLDEATRNAAPAEAQPFFDLAASVVEAYGDRLRIVEGDEEVAPGLTTMHLPGHTPGHMGVMLDGGGDAGLLMWADIVHVPPVQFAMPQVTIGFDTDPSQAAETRAAILDRVASDRLMVAGAHMTFPGLANIATDGDGYRDVPAGYDYAG